MRILIAEDDPTSALLLKRALGRDGHEIEHAEDGAQGLEALGHGKFDLIITDWMMPNIDGIGLIEAARATLDPAPPIIMITALGSSQSRQRALDAGADLYLTKPVEPAQVREAVLLVLARQHQPMPAARAQPPKIKTAVAGPFIGVGITASTGGPEALRNFFSAVQPDARITWFLVLHGPAWMLETFTARLDESSALSVIPVQDGMDVQLGAVHVCPGDVHMELTSGGGQLRLTKDEPENFVRPAADPLFRSLGRELGRRAIAVVLTGMGRDGSRGSQLIHENGGLVFAQDPSQSVAPSMPRSVENLGLCEATLPLSELPDAVRSAAILRAPQGDPQPA